MLKLNYSKSFIVEAGLDEAGRGPLAGPVYAAAVILPKGYKNKRLNDSKQLSEAARNNLRLEIERDAVSFGVAFCTPKEIDTHNILACSILAMHRAVEQLSVSPELLVVDGNRFKPFLGIPHQCVVKGDAKFMHIAAASILAKVYRDEYMEKIAEEYPMYDWKKNKGYPTLQHRRMIAEHGFSPYHRLTFRSELKEHEQ
ncbi:MAG: ribonuclease HII [Chitinophagales bacterium]|nr:ribonuclease HII [Chitinophagales bacterium]